MPIEFACPCGKQFRVDDSLAGREGQCSRCGKKLKIPRPSASPPGTPTAPQASPAPPVPSIHVPANIPQAVPVVPTAVAVPLGHVSPTTFTPPMAPQYPTATAQAMHGASIPHNGVPRNADHRNLLFSCFSVAASADSAVKVRVIPSNKLKTARNSYARGMRQDETTCVLVDNTVLGSAKKGLLFTDRACYHKTNSPSGVFAFDDVTVLSGKTGWPNYELVVHLRGGNTQKIDFLSSAAQAACETFLVALIQNQTENGGAVAMAPQPPAVTSVAPGISSPDAAAKHRCPKCQGNNVQENSSTSAWAKPVNWIIGVLLYVCIAHQKGLIGLAIAAVIWSIVTAVINAVAGKTELTCAACDHSWAR